MNSVIPLAERLRPTSLSDIVGQDHLIGKNGILSIFVQKKYLPSLIFWGPPGVGKTSIAKLLSGAVGANFELTSAVTSKLSDIRQILDQAKTKLKTEQIPTVLFIDEIHRFNKAQQDALLPYVEDGSIIFIGATTENPSFEVISPLLSRCRVVLLKQLNENDLNKLITRGLKILNKDISEDAKESLIQISNHDGRQLYTILEISAQLSQSKIIQKNDIETAAQESSARYDTHGEEHFNTISAFIKSMRTSDVDASLYYLARMINSGEDPLFIARRMVIFAAEDIGLAQPTALVVANNVFDAVNKIGYPEAQIILGYGTTYLAQAKKDRSAYDAYFSALEDVTTYGNLPIPISLRNASTKLMKDIGYSKGYTMYTTESRLPNKLKNKKYFKKG